jgi:hypothetical protein
MEEVGGGGRPMAVAAWRGGGAATLATGGIGDGGDEEE